MNILISNDDGVHANGIHALCENISSSHNIFIVAPDRERSAAGHSITLNTPLRVDELSPLYGSKRTWSVSGTPGDCIKIAVNAILSQNEMPELVISGINHGPNLGFDILYSGTVSCAIEGAMMNIPSISVSLNSNSFELSDFQFAANFINGLIPKLNEFSFPHKAILNINIPSVNSEDISGVAITEMGGRMFTDNYEKRIDPRGKTYYWMAGKLNSDKDSKNTDIEAIRNNQISITPITFELTRKSVINDLKSVLCKNKYCDWFLN